MRVLNYAAGFALGLILLGGTWLLAEEPPAPLRAAEQLVSAKGGPADVWVSNGWMMTAPKDDQMVTAEHLASGKKVWLDASQLVGEARLVQTATRLHDGFLLAGLASPVSGSLESRILRLDNDGRVIKSYTAAVYERDGTRDDEWEGFELLQAAELPNHDIAVLWVGHRDRRDRLQLAVSVLDENLELVRDVYGPVTMAAWFTSPYITMQERACQVRVWRGRLVIVDGINRHLVLADLKGEVEADIDLAATLESPVLISGSSIEPTGINLLCLRPEDPGEEGTATVAELVRFDQKGRLKARVAAPEGVRVILPSDCGKTVAVTRSGVYWGTLK